MEKKNKLRWEEMKVGSEGQDSKTERLYTYIAREFSLLLVNQYKLEEKNLPNDKLQLLVTV